MKVAALAGGVGGAKLLEGLQRVVAPGDLTAIVNTGDDAQIYGLHVSPDVDIVTYWLAGIADTDRGWGIRGDTFDVVDGLSALGEDSWFRLGDRDLATCLHRTRKMQEGRPLSVVTDDIRVALGINSRVIPMSDEFVRTHLKCSDGRVLEFQEYFVKERHEPVVESVEFRGADVARPAPGVLESLADADVVVICPSNPILSVGPILAITAIRDLLETRRRVVAVTPIVGGKALKGPADKLLAQMGIESSASGVAAYYDGLCDVFVVDSTDSDEVAVIRGQGRDALSLPTVMRDADDSARLAGALLDAGMST